MSQENVEIVQGLYEAFGRADPEALNLLHPEAELHQLPDLAGGGSHFGRQAFGEAMAAFMADWDDLRFEPTEITEAGEYVVVQIRAWGRGRVSGMAGERREFHAWTVRGGKPHQCFVRTTKDEALEAVGLRE